jgi:hypothetical protein
MIILPLRFRVILVISVLLIIMGIVINNRNSKLKTDYKKITSSITFIGRQFGELPYRDLGKFRYIKIKDYPFPFEIFIGNEAGDFKAKSEKLDSLKIGDIISVYSYETANTRQEGINRFAQFIEKDNALYFERGNSNKILGLVIISISILLIIFSYIMMRMKKIRY